MNTWTQHLRFTLAFATVVAVSASIGCGGKGAPPPDGQLHIENVAKWYQSYRAKNRNAPPPDEAAFLKFIKDELSSRGDTSDLSQIFISPRDGQKYIIQYGEPTAQSMEKNVAVQEREGYDGKKLIAFEAAWAKEVDEAELQALLSEE